MDNNNSEMEFRALFRELTCEQKAKILELVLKLSSDETEIEENNE